MGKMILNGVPYGVTPKETINMKPYSEITLWENANGLSISSPTSISLVDDINNYDALCIIHAAGVETTFRSSQIIPVSNIDKTGNTNFGIFDVGANNYYYAVLTYIDDTHITLGSWGSQYPIIYYKIIGIKYGGNLSPIIYSTDEREVGVWVDGKPLYRKTQVGGVTFSANDTWYNTSFTGIDTMVKCDFNLLRDNESVSTGFNAGHADITLRNNAIIIKGYNLALAEENFTLDKMTVEYTKITD